MGAPPDLQLPRPTQWPAWAFAASVALHGMALAALILLFAAPHKRPPAGRFLGLLPVAASPASRTVIALPPPPSSMAIVGAAPIMSRPEVPASARLFASPDSTGLTRVALDSLATWGARDATRPATWPSLASGLLWDLRPPPPVVVSRTHAERTDSAVKAILDHYLDSLAALPGGGRLLAPTWKANIGGQEYGLDGNYLTVAGVKIPAFVLGLIPLPVGGNESEALDKAGWMRAQDYELAMPRDAARADQEAQIKAIRERLAAEQELRQRQRVPPGEVRAE